MFSNCRRCLGRWPEYTTANAREPNNEALSFLHPRFFQSTINGRVNVNRFSTWTYGRDISSRSTKRLQSAPHIQKRFNSAPGSATSSTATADAPQFRPSPRRLRVKRRDYTLHDICWGWRPDEFTIPPHFDNQGTVGFDRWLEEKFNENKEDYSPTSSKRGGSLASDGQAHDASKLEDRKRNKIEFSDDWISRGGRILHGRFARHGPGLIKRTTEHMIEFLKTPSTSMPTEGNHKVLHLPYEKVANLFGSSLGSGSTICLRLGSGCYVQFHSPDAELPGKKEDCVVTLHGSDYSIALAEAEILYSMDSLVEQTASTPSSSSDPDSVAAETGKGKEHRLPVFKAARRLTHHAFLDPPPVWTHRSFADYLHRLTKLCTSPQNHFLVSPIHKVHPKTVCDIIYDLCANENQRDYLSSEAVDTAITFLAQNDCHKHISQLLPMFEGLITTATMDVLFYQAARTQNLFRLNEYSEMMGHLKLKPSGLEWLYIVAALETSPFRLTLLAELNNRGLIKDSRSFRWAVSVSLAAGFRKHINDGKSFLSYIQTLDDVLGQDWISNRAINTMLFEASYMKRLDIILDILVYCEREQIQLRSASLNKALIYFVHTKSLQKGIRFYLDFVATFGVQRNSTTMRLLWHLGIRKRSYNVCRVVWMYACLEGRVSKEMREMMEESLSFMMNPKPKDTYRAPQRIFLQNFGKVAAGALPPADKVTSLRSVDRFYEPPSEAFSHLFTYLTGGRPREQQLKLAKRIVEEDMDACKYSYEVPPFDEMIQQAAKVDLLWGPPTELWPRKVRLDAMHVDVRRVTSADTFKVLKRSLKPNTQPAEASTTETSGQS